MQSLLRRSPLMMIPAAAGGAYVGALLWPAAASLLLNALGAIYRGFPFILYHFLELIGTALGGATALPLRWRGGA